MSTQNHEMVAEKLIELLEIGIDQFTRNTRPFLSGIQEAQYRLLYYLCQFPMESMTNLGKMMYISKPYMTVLVDSLIKDGYVQRLSDPHDRRIINIAITDAGREKLREIRVLMAENLRNQIQRIKQSDLDVLESAATQIIEVYKKYLIR
ncbi:MarR family transcriptional regulator [Methanospirillum sp. J.3.6.1-F.2.7.3]|jgi:DNA-binding MarR family transcriptional regulator|uniref:MarR family transcriptional regulator n=2 Tax=Methanospirillum TaxID=2202 RepID=A0A8E7B384_9EURY|nr:MULTISPECIES: MarR family transcriptional regulator [Methanospirillum]MDX8550710.1 MarR family transcriptional regulator [Methanospirillum hungatei]QVV90266.1 MarR family transcriptional regulator [Methanospirillum sp. J.3.6.1-F.2.7.3]QXO94654.1 MarR family transcriptional regulator [Methanospirillum hungatei]